MLSKQSTNSVLMFLMITVITTTSCSGESVEDLTDEGSQIATAISTHTAEPAPTTTATTDNANEDSIQTFSTGDIIEAGNIVLDVLGWSIHDGFGETSTPDEGTMLMTVDLILVNRGSAAISILTISHMGLKNEDNQAFEVDGKALVASGSYSPAGEIGPGERMRGQVGFQVPQGSSDLIFIFNGDEFGAGEIFVKLPPEPGTVPPPERLPGELTQAFWNMGETAFFGGLNVTVNEVILFEGDLLFQPMEGKRFIAVDVTMENVDMGPREIVDLYQMYLKDTTGQKYDVDGTALAVFPGAEYDFQIPQGEKFQGTVAFQTPEELTEFVFVVDVSIFKAGKIFIELEL